MDFFNVCNDSDKMVTIENGLRMVLDRRVVIVPSTRDQLKKYCSESTCLSEADLQPTYVLIYLSRHQEARIASSFYFIEDPIED